MSNYISVNKNSFDQSTIKDSQIIEIQNKIFLFEKEEFKQLRPEHYDTLDLLVEKHKDLLENPVYVEIGSEGELIID